MRLKNTVPELWEEWKRGFKSNPPTSSKKYLYSCNSCQTQFYINPYGKLQFCPLFPKFSVDLKMTSFKEGFYGIFPKLRKERFKNTSKCYMCALRRTCYACPALAYLEVKDETSSIPYYCELAKIFAQEMPL